MSNSNLEIPPTRPWKSLYRSAMSAAGARVNPRKVTEAEKAVLARTRELLFATGTEVEMEREALDDALYALRALQTTVTFHTAA